jgi:hypothetical protein
VQETYGTDDVEDVGAQELAGLVVQPPNRAPILPEMVNLRPEDIPGPPAAREDAAWFPEDASVNVWSADSLEQSEFLVAALHENGIHCRLDEQATHAKLFVLPHDAARAREIICEVTEQTPPE